MVASPVHVMIVLQKVTLHYTTQSIIDDIHKNVYVPHLITVPGAAWPLLGAQLRTYTCLQMHGR
jgi:hypothetical protein